MAYQDNRSFLEADDVPLNAPTSDERTLAMLSHILTVVPGVGILAPLIIYILKNRESQFVAFHSRESLNFQITVFIMYFIAVLLIIILIGFFLLWLIGIINVILAVIATIKASENKLYRYPFSIRIIS
jgi:uncharacterized protein